RSTLFPYTTLFRSWIELLNQRRRYGSKWFAFRVEVVDAHDWYLRYLRQEVVRILQRVRHHLTHATGDLHAEDRAGLGLATRVSNREAEAVPEFSPLISG